MHTLPWLGHCISEHSTRSTLAFFPPGAQEVGEAGDQHGGGLGRPVDAGQYAAEPLLEKEKRWFGRERVDKSGESLSQNLWYFMFRVLLVLTTTWRVKRACLGGA